MILFMHLVPAGAAAASGLNRSGISVDTFDSTEWEKQACTVVFRVTHSPFGLWSRPQNLKPRIKVTIIAENVEDDANEKCF